MLTEARCRAAKPGQRPDGSAKRAMPLDESGLYLQVDQGADDSVSKSWLYRYSIAGKCRAIGLGSYPQVSLADARNAAAIQRAIWASGRDPLLEKRAARAELLVQIAAEAAPKPASKTFSQCAEAYIEEHKPGWKNPKSEAAWRGTLKGYAFPVIGSKDAASITTQDVLKCVNQDVRWVDETGREHVTPLWLLHNSTAKNLRSRIECVLDWATAMEYRTGDSSTPPPGCQQGCQAEAPCRAALHRGHQLSWTTSPRSTACRRRRSGSAS
jgi:hypothetical protein